MNNSVIVTFFFKSNTGFAIESKTVCYNCICIYSYNISALELYKVVQFCSGCSTALFSCMKGVFTIAGEANGKFLSIFH